MFTIAFIILVLISTPVYAVDFSPGDSVNLVERDIGIPVHPGPGDNRISFRFAGEEIVKVMSIDQQTTWVLVRSSDNRSGWITQKYIASIATPAGDDNGGELSWCPPKRSSQPHPSGRLRIATWNMANLHSQNGKAIFNGSDPSETRATTDYERIKCYVRMFDPDILAVQEVDGEEALQRVVDTDIYNLHVSSRPKSPGLNGKQNTGFAYKKVLSVEELEDFDALNVTGGLRHGTQIRLSHNGRSVKLMSVHMKSGCFDNSSSGGACSKLFQQVPVLETWIDDNAEDNVPFIILGDFNRRFNMLGDEVWAEIDDGQPTNADLTAITENKSISCRDNKFDKFIDHIVFDKMAWEWVEDSSFRHQTYRQQDKEVWGQISDHCAVIVDLWIE